MSKQQTAVEWLANELFKQLTGEPDKISLKEVLEQAKAMEKEQMKEAVLSQVTKHKTFRSLFEKQFEQYFYETYG